MIDNFRNLKQRAFVTFRILGVSICVLAILSAQTIQWPEWVQASDEVQGEIESDRLSIARLNDVGVASDDHGNNKKNATVINVPSRTKGNLESKRDKDYFKFSAAAGFTYVLYTLGKTDTFMELRTKKGKSLTRDNNGGSKLNSKLIYMNTTDGDLYIKVQGARASVTGPYRLKAEKVLTEKGPYARADHAIAFSGDSRIVLMFGGAYSGNFFNDTWEWDGKEWQRPTSLSSPSAAASVPSPRSRHAMTYDGENQVFVLFGGKNQDGRFGDTWEWDGVRWQRVAKRGPTAREGHAMAFDPEQGVVYLFGGMDGNGYFNDLWKWDGIGWTRIARKGNIEPRSEHAMVWDGENNRLFVFGGCNDATRAFGDTWVWDGDNWTELTYYYGPDARKGHAMAYHLERNHIVAFGGDDGFYNVMNDTRLWRTEYSYWSTKYYRPGDPFPSARAGHAMVYDSYRNEVILFGGWDKGVLNNETWIWTGKKWAEVTGQEW